MKEVSNFACRPIFMSSNLLCAKQNRVSTKIVPTLFWAISQLQWGLKSQGLRQDSEAATINKLTDQSNCFPCVLTL